MEDLYEFGSLAFAAMPYRFVFLTIDTWTEASIVFVIKYTYKTLGFFIALKYKK